MGADTSIRKVNLSVTDILSDAHPLYPVHRWIGVKQNQEPCRVFNKRTLRSQGRGLANKGGKMKSGGAIENPMRRGISRCGKQQTALWGRVNGYSPPPSFFWSSFQESIKLSRWSRHSWRLNPPPSSVYQTSETTIGE